MTARHGYLVQRARGSLPTRLRGARIHQREALCRLRATFSRAFSFSRADSLHDAIDQRHGMGVVDVRIPLGHANIFVPEQLRNLDQVRTGLH